ncbi:MAG: hypothetical protein GY928_13165 [Colwellia sp.]|nr:hypothetical protein [Colwellia sp.]
MILIILTFGFVEYVVNPFIVGCALAFFIQKRRKFYPWFPTIILLVVLFALSELLYIPLYSYLDATFTINNKEVAKWLGTSENESLKQFMMNDIMSLTSWFIQSGLAFTVSWFLTKKQIPNQSGKGDACTACGQETKIYDKRKAGLNVIYLSIILFATIGLYFKSFLPQVITFIIGAYMYFKGRKYLVCKHCLKRIEMNENC